MGITETDSDKLAREAFHDPQTTGNPRDLTLESYKQIYRRALGVQPLYRATTG